MARQFGQTWWGRAWIDALEHRAELDPNRLPRGRTYARQGRAARVTVEPGKVTALVRGSRALPYRVTITVPTYDDDDWTRVAGAVAQRSGTTAALLDGELDPTLVDDAAIAGVALFPGPGDLKPRCSCPDWADPCKHAAAVCYLVADELDADPFVLFALRGAGRDDFLDLVRAARRGVDSGSADTATGRGTGPGGSGRMVAAAFGGGAVVDPGMVAREAWQRTVPALPERRDIPRAAGTPAAWPADPPRDAPFTATGLTDLATDAARRAWAQLADGAPSYLDLDERADLARRAADRLGRLESLLELSRQTGVPSAQLTHQALAWRSAGAAGLVVVDEELWRPPTDVIDQGIRAFAEAGIGADEVQVRSNRFTHGEVQLRVSNDGRWWRFEKRGRAWELVEPPTTDPADLISS